MKPYIANYIYGFVLIIFSLTGYFTSDNPSPTAFIPTIFGVVFLILTLPLKSGSKLAAHIVVIFTFLLIISLIKPLTGAIGRSDSMAILRVGIMLGWGIFAMYIYIKSFMDARRNKPIGQ